MNYIPVIGLMSGTSIDGIDASIVLTNGNNLIRTNYNSITPYSKATRTLLKKCYENPESIIKNNNKKSYLSKLITIEHTKAAQQLIKLSKIEPTLIGFHGQTIFHNPLNKISVQLGNAQLMANLLKIKVLHQFRKEDLKNGGQGAPLAPIYHKQILNDLNIKLPGVIINLGGIANISYWDGKLLLGFDTGPGNNLMDHFMKNKFNKPYDENGALASKGNANLNLIEKFCNNAFFKYPPPKSLERKQLINNKYFKEILLLKPRDCMATLCLLTAETIRNSFKFLPIIPETVLIVGGGQRNKFLVETIKNHLTTKVYSSDEINLPGDYIEAELIGFLAARKFYNLPSTFPSTTGTCKNTINGEMVDFNNFKS